MVPDINAAACVQNFQMQEKGKSYEMVIKTEHNGPKFHVAAIPGNHEKVSMLKTYLRSGGYTFYTNNPSRIYSIIIEIGDGYRNMKKGERDWVLSEGDVVGGEVRGMVPCIIGKPDVGHVRMIKLTALRKHHPHFDQRRQWPCALGVSRGGYVGLSRDAVTR